MLKDVLRLSRSMTYKAALAHLNLGRGKAVIIGHPKNKNPLKLQAFGRMVERLKGFYITAENVGTSPQDTAEIHKTTSLL